MSSAKLNFIKLILTNLNDLIQRDPRHVYGYSIFRYLNSKQLNCFMLDSRREGSFYGHMMRTSMYVFVCHRTVLEHASTIAIDW